MAGVILLPGILAPAKVRFAPLLEFLGDVDAIPKDLELYAGDAPPAGYGVEAEVAGIETAADRAGFAEFHLFGMSAGGACALAFAAAHPDRLLSLAVEEPATDFSAEDRDDPVFARVASAQSEPGPEALASFLRLQLAPGVEPPPPPSGPPPPWMASRPAGIGAFVDAIGRYRVDPARYESFTAPVLYIRGSLSNPRWETMCGRLEARFPDFSSELFEGLHHLNAAHQAEPERAAALLRSHWDRGEAR